MELEELYYSLNNFWLWFNLAVTVPFFIAFVNRYRNQSFNTRLWTDYLTRGCFLLTMVFYLLDILTKSVIDGTESICQKAIIIHHTASLFILAPMVYNSYVPWEADVVGFIHGYIVFFDNHTSVQYFYGIMMIYLHFRLHQSPYKKLDGFWLIKLAINFVWVFIIFYKVGDCSNYLEIEADNICTPI